jgi:hypothetical protein
VALFTGSDVEVGEMKMLYLCPLSLRSFEGFFQKDLCVTTSSRTAKES